MLIEAVKRSGWEPEPWADLHEVYKHDDAFRALCDMIQKYEQPPVDRKLLCAREAATSWASGKLNMIDTCVRAIELFEEGFGHD